MNHIFIEFKFLGEPTNLGALGGHRRSLTSLVVVIYACLGEIAGSDRPTSVHLIHVYEDDFARF